MSEVRRAGETLSGLAREIASHDGVPGAALATVVDGELWSGTVGSCDLGSAQPLTADARFLIYSVTKTMIAAALLRLAEQGRVSLDQDPADLVPEYPRTGGLTLRRLLNHTGGVPDYGGAAAYNADLKRDPETPWTVEDFLDWAVANGPAFAPGEGWGYSNIGYLLLRLSIERVTGQTFRQALAELVIAPVGLKQTSVVDTLAEMPELTPGYSTLLSEDGAPGNVIPRYHPGWVSHGVVASNAPELARYLDALFAGRIVSERSLAEMLDAVDVPHPHPLFGRPSYGLGLMVDRESPFGLVAGHGGGGPGYAIGAFHFPDVHGHRVTSVALANSDAGDSGMQLAFTVAHAIADWLAAG